MSIEKSEAEIILLAKRERLKRVREWLQWGNEFDEVMAEWCLKILYEYDCFFLRSEEDPKDSNPVEKGENG